MAPYKRQHYLPLAYLGQFGRPPERELRKRMIWRVSGTHAGEVPVGSQCQEDYFYSKDRAAQTEGYFGKVESIYGSLLARAVAGEQLSRETLFTFFLASVDFYARGSKFRVRDEQEEFGFYLKRIEIFKTKLLGPLESEKNELAARDRVLRDWEFAIIPFPEDAALLTSDSPAIWFSSSKTPDLLRGVLMPITPLACFVGAHRDSYRIAGKAGTGDDAALVAHNEAENCVEAVYCSEPLAEPEIALIRKWLGQRSVPAQTRDGWAFELIDYDLNPNLSFIANK